LGAGAAASPGRAHAARALGAAAGSGAAAPQATQARLPAQFTETQVPQNQGASGSRSSASSLHDSTTGATGPSRRDSVVGRPSAAAMSCAASLIDVPAGTSTPQSAAAASRAAM